MVIATVARKSVDLAAWPELTVVYLGFSVKAWTGLPQLLKVGRGIAGLLRDKPDGLLAHQSVKYGVLHVGMRQYWRDLESLEKFTRTEPHSRWWAEFSGRDHGVGFWHETYRLRGGMEAIYVGMPGPTGFGLFAPERDPAGALLTARSRLG